VLNDRDREIEPELAPPAGVLRDALMMLARRGRLEIGDALKVMARRGWRAPKRCTILTHRT
jgi:hypothetical protein